MYVDNVLTGANDLDHALQLKSEFTSLLESAGFKLAKWASNHDDVIPSEESNLRPLGDDSSEQIKTLGLLWDPIRDEFAHRICLNAVSQPFTKRKIFYQVAKIFDPLSWSAPVVI